MKQTRAILRRKDKRSRKAARKTGTTDLKCPAGQIKRRAYIRRSRSGKRTAVGAKCVTNRGAPGKAKRTILLREGMLEKYGYDDVRKLTKAQRERALRKAAKEEGYVEVIRRLVAIANLNVRTNPKLSAKYKADQDMVSKWYKQSKK